MAALAASPCGPVVASPADPKLAAAYLEVGEAALAATDFETAAIALTRALSFDSSLASAAALRERACLSFSERWRAARAAEAQLRSLEQGGAAFGAPLSALLRQASRGGRLIARASLFGGVDSNPALAPPALAVANGLVGFTALLQFSPLGAVSPYARLAAGGREYPGLPHLRTFTGAGTLGFQLGRGGDRVAVDYSLDGVLFGADPYAVTHGPRLEGSLQLGPVLLFAEWMLRFEKFLPADAAVFSGIRQDAALGASTVLPAGFSLEAAWSLTRDEAQLPELALVDQGPRLTVGWARGRTRAMAGAALDWRSYDAFDADLGVQRADLRLRPSVRVEVDLTDWLSLYGAGDATFIWSNVEAVTAARVAATGGAQLWAGLW